MTVDHACPKEKSPPDGALEMMATYHRLTADRDQLRPLLVELGFDAEAEHDRCVEASTRLLEEHAAGAVTDACLEKFLASLEAWVAAARRAIATQGEERVP